MRSRVSSMGHSSSTIEAMDGCQRLSSLPPAPNASNGIPRFRPSVAAAIVDTSRPEQLNENATTSGTHVEAEAAAVCLIRFRVCALCFNAGIQRDGGWQQ